MANIKNRKFISVLFCTLLLILLLLLSYKMVLFFTDATPAQKQVFSFLDGKGELATEFTELEISHLQDVKKVMKYADYLFYLMLSVVTAMITIYRKDKVFLLHLLNYGGKVTIAAVLLVGVSALLSFDQVFAAFHKIFFPQGNWTFAADSMLIQTFPLDFFVGISWNVFLLTFFLGILFIVSGYIYGYVLRDRN